LRVAYYNDKTGQLEVLETKIDGNVLVFTAATIGDFVIMGDPNINLSNLLLALAVILLLQATAIVLLLIRRKKSASVRNYAFAPIVGLTIRISPNYALTAIVIFGVLILLFQIFLIYLLLSSDLVSRNGKRLPPYGNIPVDNYGNSNAQERANVITMHTHENDPSAEEEPVLHSLTELDIQDNANYGALYESDEDYRLQDEETESDPAENDGATYANAFLNFDDDTPQSFSQASMDYAYDKNGQAYLSDDAIENETIEGASYYGIDEDNFTEPTTNSVDYVEEDFEEGNDLSGGDFAQTDFVGSSFDDEEELATGAEYYDEPVE